MVKYFCNDCETLINPNSDHIVLGNVVMVKSGKVQQVQEVHLCDNKCCISFMNKGWNRPVLVSGPHQ